MIDVKRIYITKEEMRRCEIFSVECAKTQQEIEFGQQTTAKRSLNEIARDNLIGKLAEVAFSKMIYENYGLEVPLDYNYYPRGKWDNMDAEINGWRIDVKGTRKGGKWFLLEWHKLVFRQRDDNLSHMYAMFTVDWDRNADRPTGIVSYEGVVSLEKLNDHTKNTHVLRKGDLLPGTRTPLQADNYGILFKDLYKHLNHTVEHIVRHKPPKSLTENYRNPYTGMTTAQIKAEKHIQEQARIEVTPTRIHYAEPIPAEEKPKKIGLWERIKRWFSKLH